MICFGALHPEPVFSTSVQKCLWDGIELQYATVGGLGELGGREVGFLWWACGQMGKRQLFEATPVKTDSSAAAKQRELKPLQRLVFTTQRAVKRFLCYDSQPHRQC